MMGNALIARLFYSLRKRNVPILSTPRFVDLDQRRRPRHRRGAFASTARTRVVRRAAAWCLRPAASAHNEELRAASCRSRCSPPSQSQAQPATASRSASSSARGHRGDHAQPASGRRCPITRPDGGTGPYPHLALDRAKPGLIAVNSAGRRFVNEAASYHDFVDGMFGSPRDRAVDPGVADLRRAFIRNTALARSIPARAKLAQVERRRLSVRGGHARRAAPRRSGSMPRACARPSPATTAFAETGVDVDFGKGATELNRFNGDPSHKPNPCVGPIATPPFYAMAVYPADSRSAPGSQTDADARVLDATARRSPASMHAATTWPR